jgi:hypothetical protein
MKYLKKFESLFGPAEPKQITVGEWSRMNKSLGREFFSRSEMDNLVDLMEESGREHMEEDEWDHLGMTQKVDYYRIGVTFLTFYNPSSDKNNPYPDEIHIQKCKDEWFLVSFYRDDWDGDEGYFEGYEEYYECDGFECLLDLLENNCDIN